MRVVVKKTFELSDLEIVAIYKLFEEVFHQVRDVKTFRDNYSNTPMGFSYHSLLLDDSGEIVGFHSCMPFYYLNGDERFMAALGIDSMVKREFRDYFNFRDMINSCQEQLKQDGCVLRIGFPNDNSYPILKKGLKHKDVGKLRTYCLIRNIGAIKPQLASLNFMSRFVSFGQYLFAGLFISRKVYTYRYRKERASFDLVRYKWFGGNYNQIMLKDGTAVYKTMCYQGVRTAFLLDVYPMSRRNFESAVRKIYARETNETDMILYVGQLPFTPVSLWTVPFRFAPKHFNFTCKPLVEGYFDDTLFDLGHWEINLSNYDLL